MRRSIASRIEFYYSYFAQISTEKGFHRSLGSELTIQGDIFAVSE
jgi:hypothetical protein